VPLPHSPHAESAPPPSAIPGTAGIGATDPLVFLGVPALLVDVAAAASCLPALQVRIDPLQLLREE